MKDNGLTTICHKVPFRGPYGLGAASSSCSPYLIDTAGRKKLMAVGSGLMVLFALGISFSYANNYQLLMLIFVMCFTSCFAFSMGPIPWIMIPELFPTYLRGRATGICIVFL